MITNMLNDGAIPTLAKAVQFAARRQELLAHNIANISTPDFRPTDVSTRDFQRSLGDAIDRRRARYGASRGDYDYRGTREVQQTSSGNLRLTPETPSANILFHDRNNRDLERSMQDMVENLTAFRVAADLLKNRMDLMNAAIRERV